MHARLRGDREQDRAGNLHPGSAWSGRWPLALAGWRVFSGGRRHGRLLVTGRIDTVLFSGAGAGGMGEPSHFEIGVPDSRRAQVFYGGLLGWKFNEGGRNSAAIETAGVPGGVHEAAVPGLVVFFSVPDLDAAVRRVRELGGEVDPRRSEGPAGKYASSCRDDQGVPFGLHQPAAG